MRAGALILAICLPALFAGEGAGTFRTGTSLVLVNVSVLDVRDRPVPTLAQSQFRVLDNGREQPIRFFAHDDAPVSLAIVLDTSGSMKGKWDRARSMLSALCRNLEPADELFLVTVQARARLAADYTRDCGELAGSLLFTEPRGTTALLDAIPIAVRHLRQARHARHVILIVSDGGENSSRTRLSSLRGMAREANAQIYSASLGLEARFARHGQMGEPDGPELLEELAALSGGRAFTIESRRETDAAAAALAREIHDQYVLGYQPPEAPDGKFHHISVKVDRAAAQPRFSLFHRNGYRAE